MSDELLRLEAEPIAIEPPERAAPRYELEHPAGDGIYADWVDVLLPMRQAKRLGVDRGAKVSFRTITGSTHPAVVHRRAGLQGYRMRVMASFPRAVIHGDFVPAEGLQVPRFIWHPSVAGIAAPTVPGMVIQNSATIQESPAERVDRFGYSNEEGDVVVIFRRVRCLHPVIDYGVRFGSMKAGGSQSMFTARFYDAETVQAVPWCRFDEVLVSAEAGLGLYADLDWGCAPTVWVRCTYPAVGDEGPIEEQLRAMADKSWPVGRCLDWQTEDGTGTERWLALGVLPKATELDATVIASKMRKLFDLEQPGSIYADRPGAQARSTNQAGSQRFGAAAGGVAAKLRPAEAFAYLRTCAGDEELRPVHWYEGNGSVLRAKHHKALRTHNRRIDWRNTRDKIGLQSEPPRIAPSTRRTADDEQHMDDLGIDAFLGLWDDPALEETRQHMVELDALDTQRLDGRRNSAARGVGRPMLSMSTAAWLLEGTESGLLAQACVELENRALMETYEGKTVPGLRPVRPVSTLKGVSSWDIRDPRTGEPMRAAAPYEHATVVVGLIAAAQVLRQAEAQQALFMAGVMTQTVLAWAYESGGAIVWPFVVGVLEGEEDGLALPAAWDVPGTVEFGMTHITGGSWTTWTAAVAFAESYLRDLGVLSFLPAELSARAERVRAAFAGYQGALAERFTAIPTRAAQAQPVVPVAVGG